MPRNFLVDCWLFGKISVSRILPKSGKKSKKIPGMIFHALVTFCLTFWGWKIFDPKFGQIWPNLAKFFGPNFFSFHVKMGFAKMHWFPKFDMFISIGSKVVSLGAPRPAKAIFFLTLWPLKLSIGQMVPQSILDMPKVLVFTYNHPFWILSMDSQLF